jgi:hypothetical protein
LKLEGSYVIKKIGRHIIAFTVRAGKVEKIIRLNPTAEFIWRILENGCTKQELVDRVVKEYNITTDRAVEDVNIFIELLHHHNLLV